MKWKHWLILVLVLWFFNSCDFLPDSKSGSDDFYTAQKEGDQWRIPLLKPYSLVSPTNTTDWFLILQSPMISGPDFMLFGEEFQLTSITQLGIQDSVIYLESADYYWPKLSGSYPSVLFVDLKTDSSFVYTKELHQKAILQKKKALNIETIELYDFETVKSDFQQKGKLPIGWVK